MPSILDTLCGLIPCCPLPFFTKSNGSKNEETPEKHVYHTEVKESEADFKKAFNTLADDDELIDAYNLQHILNNTFKNDIPGFLGFNKDFCRSMVAVMDYDYSGKLDYEQAHALRDNILAWRRAFAKFDTSEAGYFYSHEFQSVLRYLDVKVSAKVSLALMQRYGDKYGHVRFEEFISCMSKLTVMLETFHEQSDGRETATFTCKEFMQLTMYS